MMDPAKVVERIAALCLVHRRQHGEVKPRHIVLSPRAYRAWRNSPERLGDDFLGVPVRCVENIRAGYDVEVQA